MTSYNPRKRQRPIAIDYFNSSNVQNISIQSSNQNQLLEISSVSSFQQSNRDHQEYLSKLKELVSIDQEHLIIELIRGKDSFDFNSSWKDRVDQKYLFIFRSSSNSQFLNHSINQFIHLHHLATLLWGPGKKEIAHAKAIYSAHLSFKLDPHHPSSTIISTREIATEDLYVIEFSSSAAAESAEGLVQYHLNKFLLSLDHQADTTQTFLIRVHVGSSRWLVKNPGRSIDETQWKTIKKTIPHLRPLPRAKSPTLPPVSNTQTNVDTCSFELFQLPQTMTIENLIQNFLKINLDTLPIQIKLTKESNSVTPIRILLKFSTQLSATISKLTLLRLGLKSPEDERLQFLMDDGDSSIEDRHFIWRHGTVWNKQQISDLAASFKNCKQKLDESEIDELQEENKAKVEEYDSDIIAQFFDESSVDQLNGPDHRRSARRRAGRRYERQLLGNLLREKKRAERLASELENRRLSEQQKDPKPRKGVPSSVFYDTAKDVSYNRKFDKLMVTLEKKRITTRQLKHYREKKSLRKRIRQQSSQRPDESSETDSSLEDSADDEFDLSDEASESQLASYSAEQWERNRKKRRIQRMLKKNQSSDESDSAAPKDFITNEEVFRYRFSRPRERTPGDNGNESESDHLPAQSTHASAE